MNIDTVWWWTGVTIRQAQQLGLHREPKPAQGPLAGEAPGLRKRIWWKWFASDSSTLFRLISALAYHPTVPRAYAPGDRL